MKLRLCSRDFRAPGNTSITRLVWVNPEGDEGSALGDDVDTRDHRVASAAVSLIGPPQRDREGFYWTDSKTVGQALRAAKAAIRNRSDVPMPEWASLAIANGWKPPKGWAP